MNNPNVFTDPDGNFTTSIYNSASEFDVSGGSFNNGFTNVSFAAAAYSVGYYDFSGKASGEYRRRASDVETGRIFNYKGDPNNVKVLYDDYWEWVSGPSGGMTDFTNSNHALNIGAGIYGSMKGLTSSQGYWLGDNGKYYSTNWGGNRYTGSRTGAFKAANTYKLAGKAVVVGQVLIGGYSTYEGYVADGGAFGYNTQRAAASSAASIGLGLAGAQAGAAAGAFIGAWFGGVGAVPGAVIGGVIGGFGLGVGGSYLGSYLGRSAVDYYHGR